MSNSDTGAGADIAAPAATDGVSPGVPPEVPPLAGIRVLAIEQLMAMPFATQLLADFGADVISVESIGYDGYEAVPWRERTGRHKRRIQVKLNDARGQDLIRRIAHSVDIVAENFRPGVLDRYGLGYQDMQKVNPALIFVSISGYGHPDFLKSELWSQGAYGPIGEAMSGVMHSLREQGGHGSGLALGDVVSAMFATVGMLVALRHRELTGRGQYLDVSMADSLFALGELPFVKYSLARNAGPAPSGRNARRAYVDYPSGVFSASDGEFQLIMMNEGHWNAFCLLLGHEEWNTDPLLNDPVARPAAIQSSVLPVFREWAKNYGKRDVADLMRAAGLAAAPINAPADVDTDPHFAARRMIETVTRADGSSLRVAGNPIKLSAIEAARDLSAPPPRIARPGQHTRDVLRDVFDIAEDEYAELAAAGVIRDTSVPADPAAPA
jgi:crotonobetainyl-CoA:carnitine CoA-transferase CaiB-like acyl-CoA transferase